jgi:hypothetical protein
MRTIRISIAALALAATFTPGVQAACKDCGTVTDVKTVKQKGEGSGLGAVAGGVVGGVLGHQVGSGRGNTAATVVGAGAGAYAGHEICLAARGSAESIDVVDVTNHAAPVEISSFRYQPVGTASYSHQAWFTEDHAFILLNDEFDERDLGHPTRTWIFDAQDLDALELAGPNGYFEHSTAARPRSLRRGLARGRQHEHHARGVDDSLW